MPQKYAGRVALILVVLYVGLFGIPGLTGGIYQLDLLGAEKVKLNLRPGIDIAGGTSLVYEIKPPPGGFKGTGTLAEEVSSLLKKRVDPTGTRNLIWRPQGDTRLEIQLPRSSMSKEGTSQVRDAYRKASGELGAFNITVGQVVGAVEDLKGDQRAARLKQLERGSESRKNIFAVLTSLYDKLAGLQKQIDELQKPEKKDEKKLNELSQQWAQTRIEYEKEQAKIEPTNLQVTEVEALIENQKQAAEVKKELDALKTRFPERKALIEKLEEVYPKYLVTKGSIDDAADLKRLLRGSGVLEFHIMAMPPGAGRGDVQTVSMQEYEQMVTRLAAEGPTVKAGDQLRWFEVARPEEYTGPTQVWRGKRLVLAWVTPEKSMVHREGGKDWALQRSYPTPSQRGDLIVGFEFDDVGATLFASLTGNNIGKLLGTILDGKVITAPAIRSQIGKSGTIDGGDKGYSEAERTYLVNTLNAGSLPAQLADEPISEREVGPQLGESNLRDGMNACFVGLIVVAIFLFAYYHLAGVVAFMALLMNLVIILGILAMMNATFTLPGIAGLVLTIGVTVDANVLIFERLREEQLRGLSVKLAIRNAYDRAFTAILDSNVTTAITSAFLIYFGSEEVKGFGLTLLIGILSSLFSALFVTKTIFGLMIDKYGLRKLGSLPLTFPRWQQIMHPKIDWMGKVKWFLAGSAIVIGLGGFAFVQQAYKGTLLDVEFTSGTEVQVTTTKKMTDGEVRERIAKKAKEIPQPAVVSIGSEGNEFSIVTANENRNQVSTAVLEVMRDVLSVAVPSKFKGSGNTTLEEAMRLGVVHPIVVKNNRFALNGKEIVDASLYDQGAAVLLQNIDPPLKLAELKERIDRAVVAAGAANLRQFTVVALDASVDENQPTDTAVVMVADRNLAYAKSESDWREKLALPFWKSVNEGIGREASLQKVSNFDAQVAGDTQRAAIFATIGSMFAIMIWIWVRFGDHKYGTGTVLAMIHDTVMVVGAVGLAHVLADSAVGRALGIEAFRVNMTLVAAILTVMGYSMVDTIVVFDRVREIRGKYGTLSRELINDAINQTLSRTLLTAGTTLVTLFIMYVWGGSAIHGFAFILLIGIIIGTYSSIAVAAPLLLIGVKPGAGKPRSDGAKPSGAVQKVGA